MPHYTGSHGGSSHCCGWVLFLSRSAFLATRPIHPFIVFPVLYLMPCLLLHMLTIVCRQIDNSAASVLTHIGCLCCCQMDKHMNGLHWKNGFTFKEAEERELW